MAILGSLKVTLRYVFYFWIGIKKSPKANDNGAFLEFWLREQDLNLRPSGYEPDELPDCSIPRQLTRFILNLFSGSTEGRVLPSSILGCEPAELPDCSIPRQLTQFISNHFSGSTDISVLPSSIICCEPAELPDCSIPRQLTHFILNHFSGSTEGRVLPSSILGCEPAELPDCSIPRQHFRGYPLKRVGIIRITKALSKLI